MWVFYHLHKNVIFAAVILITIGCQIFIVQVSAALEHASGLCTIEREQLSTRYPVLCCGVQIGGKFTSTTGLTLYHWGWSVLLACFTTPLGVVMRWIPIKESPTSFADFYPKSEQVRDWYRAVSLICLASFAEVISIIAGRYLVLRVAA